MSLADVPNNKSCRICLIPYFEENLKYISAGIRNGSGVRVICRYPEKNPKFVEVELENSLLVTLPHTLTKEIVVSVDS